MDDPNHLGSKNSIPSPELSKFKKKFSKKKEFKFKNFSLRTGLLGLMLVIIAGFLITTYKVNEIKTRAFAVYFGKDKIGTVREKEEVLKLVEGIQENLSKTYDIDVIINEKVVFEDTHEKDEGLTSLDDVKESIESRLTFLVSGYVLLIDGKEVAVLRDKKDVEEAIDKFKKSFTQTEDENSEIKKIEILEEVDIVKKDVPLIKIKDKEEILKLIETGKKETKTHLVEVGESFWTIAKIHNMSVEELMEANPDMDPEKVYPGDKVDLVIPTSMLTVSTVEEVNYTEDVDYEVKVEEDNSMYKNEKKVKVKGSSGKNEILARIIKHNGKIVEKEILDEKIIEKPVDKIVVKGTRKVPTTVATGAFSNPTRGRISSRYGMRGGRMHKGLDIAASVGTTIKAADGGKVTFAGYRGNYGKLIEINHGNGYVTRYAHCSKMNVKVGQKVAKGQAIGAVGTTGRTTGAHLHFEVLKNGRHQNPGKYIGR